MSRIGKQPVNLPKGAKASVTAGVVLVEGPLGKLEYRPARGVQVVCDAGKIVVSRTENDKQSSANYGTTRAHLDNLVQGVTKGWKRTLELSGVGYTGKLQGSKLVLAVGKSHEEIFEVPTLIKCSITKNIIDLESIDRELLGTFAAAVRKSQPPEPYLGKGVKYSDEHVRHKAGKAGKKQQ